MLMICRISKVKAKPFIIKRSCYPSFATTQKAHTRASWNAWKACIPQKGIPGSNPGFSAKQRNGIAAKLRCFFCFWPLRKLVFAGPDTK